MKDGTDIEIKLKTFVEELGHAYDSQHYVPPTLADGFVEPNFVFFADGCYDHACPIHCPINETRFKPGNRELRRSFGPEHDARITKELIEAGFIVLRFWEHDINNDPETIKARIKSALGPMGLVNL